MPTVLLVDDEPIFRSAIARILRKRGFHALEADSVEAALALIGDPAISVHIILADIVLPRASGVELADRAKEVAPHVKVLLMSGYPLRTVEHEYGLSRDLKSVFIQKPFDSGTLTNRIRKELGMQDEE